LALASLADPKRPHTSSRACGVLDAVRLVVRFAPQTIVPEPGRGPAPAVAAEGMRMLFVIFCIDRAGAEDRRKQMIQAHVDYLATKPIKVVMSGPLTSDDGAKAIGSLFLVDAANRAEVESFQRSDPFYNAGIWETVEVRAFNKRVG